MRHYTGLHGIRLPLPPASVLADLTTHHAPQRDAALSPPTELNAKTTRRTHRILAIATRFSGRFDMMRMLDALSYETPKPGCVSDALRSFVAMGLVRRHANDGARAAWEITTAGRAIANAYRTQIATVPEAHILEAVTLINAAPTGGKHRWWPVESLDRLGEPATSTSLCDMLFSSKAPPPIRHGAEQRLHALADQGKLIRRIFPRGDNELAMFWALPGTNASATPDG